MALCSSLPSRDTNWTCDLLSVLGLKGYLPGISARYSSRSDQPLWLSGNWFGGGSLSEHLSSSSQSGKMGKDELGVSLERLQRSTLTKGLSAIGNWHGSRGLLSTVSRLGTGDATLFTGLGGRVLGRRLMLFGSKTRAFGSQMRESTLFMSARSVRLLYSTPLLLDGVSECRGIHLESFEGCSSAPGCRSEERVVRRGDSEFQSDTSNRPGTCLVLKCPSEISG